MVRTHISNKRHNCALFNVRSFPLTVLWNHQCFEKIAGKSWNDRHKDDHVCIFLWTLSLKGQQPFWTYSSYVWILGLNQTQVLLPESMSFLKIKIYRVKILQYIMLTCSFKRVLRLLAVVLRSRFLLRSC